MHSSQPTQPFFSVFDKIATDDHEQVLYCYDKATGLRAIIAIHNTALGPALGGTRIWDYTHDGDALQDALRLAKGMTYKSAVAGLSLGGGKAVIIGNAAQIKTPALLRRYGEFIETLRGHYITGPDVNTTMYDMEEIAQTTTHVSARPIAQGGSDDPSPVTAYGTYLGIKASVKQVFGTDALEGKKIGVEGVGKVGSHLVARLCQEGAQVYVTDIVQDRLMDIAQQHSVQVVSPEAFYDLPMDVYAPCALGATLNDVTIARLQCAIVAGAANNQLQDEQRHSQLLFDRGIVYVPDFVVNAGGVINIFVELLGPYSREQAYQHTERTYDVCQEILAKSAQTQHPPQAIAEQMVAQKIAAAKGA